MKVRRGSWILEVREGPWMEVRGGSGDQAGSQRKFVGSSWGSPVEVVAVKVLLVVVVVVI